MSDDLTQKISKLEQENAEWREFAQEVLEGFDYDDLCEDGQEVFRKISKKLGLPINKEITITFSVDITKPGYGDKTNYKLTLNGEPIHINGLDEDDDSY